MASWILRASIVALPVSVIAVSCGGGGSTVASTASFGGSTATSNSAPASSGSGSGGSVGSLSNTSTSAASGTSTSTTSSGATSSASGSTGSGSASTSTSSGGTGGSAAVCSPTDPMTDGKPCGTGCPAGQICFGGSTGDVCYLECDFNNQASCPCDRFCGELVGPDGGPVGGACFPANTAGERCNTTFGPGMGGCAQSLFCVTAGGSTKAYCSPFCKTQADCPAHTNCETIDNGQMMPVGMACVYDYGPSGKAEGSTCAATDACISDTLCDSTCLPQCDGPGGTCATGTCTAVIEGTKTLGYVCK